MVFGTTPSGRLQGAPRADSALGLFINTLPIRIALKWSQLTVMVHETFQQLSEPLEHEQAPLALAQRCSGVRRARAFVYELIQLSSL